MTEQRRTGPNEQGRLPIEAVEESDAAYLSCVEDLGRLARLPASVCAVLRWMITGGNRRDGWMVRSATTQRKLARALGFGLATVSTALRRLKDSRLLVQADGELRLSLSHLVEVGQEARARAAPDHGGFDAAAALDDLVVRSCSVCSVGARSVRVKSISPVPSSPSSVTSSSSPLGKKTERAPTEQAEQTEQAEHDEPLRRHPAWRVLQTRHFRPELDRPALRGAFRAAVAAGLLDENPEHKIRFLATAYDLAQDATIRRPAVCLRVRVERNSCFRISEEGNRWAKKILVPQELRR